MVAAFMYASRLINLAVFIYQKVGVNSMIHSNTPYYVTKRRSVCNGADGTPWAHYGTESRTVGTMETGRVA